MKIKIIFFLVLIIYFNKNLTGMEATSAALGGIELADESIIFPIEKNCVKLGNLKESEVRLGSGILYPEYGDNYSYNIGYGNFFKIKNVNLGGYGIDIETKTIDNVLLINKFTLGYGITPYFIFSFIPKKLKIGGAITYIKTIFKYNEWLAESGYNDDVVSYNVGYSIEASWEFNENINTILLLNYEDENLLEFGFQYHDKIIGKILLESYYKDYTEDYGIRVGFSKYFFKYIGIKAGYEINRFEEFKGGIGINWRIKFKDMDLIVNYGMPLNFNIDPIIGNEYYLSFIFCID